MVGLIGNCVTFLGNSANNGWFNTELCHILGEFCNLFRIEGVNFNRGRPSIKAPDGIFVIVIWPFPP